MKRRRFAVAFLALALLAGALYAYARWIEPAMLVVEDVTVPIPGLAPAMADLRIVFVSDIQITRPGAREERLRRKLESLDPDLLLIGGDFANVPYWMTAYVERAAAACSVVAAMPARFGKYAVWGNNDIPEAIAGFARDAGIRVLSNEWVTLELPPGELTLVGVDDPVNGRADWDRAFTDDPPRPFIAMAHSPDAFADAAARGVPLLLTGHTHGGQVLHPFIGLRPDVFLGLEPGTPPYRAGTYHLGSSTLYVTRGLGTSHVPLRFLCPPEITRVHLVSAPSGPGD